MKHVKPNDPRQDVIFVKACHANYIYAMYQGVSRKTYRLVCLKPDHFAWKSIDGTMSDSFGAPLNFFTALEHALNSGCTVLCFETVKEYATWLYEFDQS